MKNIRHIYTAGCWLFGIVCGIGHTLVDLGPKPKAANDINMLLRDVPVDIFGTQTNAFNLSFGISMIMGLMLVAYGVINLLILRETPKPYLPSRSILIANVVFSISAFLLAWFYLFILPIAFTALASACFIVSLFASGRTTGNQSELVR